MKSSCKSLDVFEFNESEELKFSPPRKMKNPKLVENGDFGTEKMSSLNGDLLLNFSRLENQQFISSELRPDGICEQLEPRVLSAEATVPMDEHLNFSLPESKSSDEADDVFADANESPVESSPSSSSYISGDYVPLGGPESSPDGCFDFVQLGNRNMALVFPDYIIYQGRYSPESVLIFSKESMKLKDSATHGDQGLSRFEWKIEDIIDIQSQWSKRLEIAMVKLRVLMKDAELLVVEEMQFAVADVNWPEKQEEIMSLNVRYKALWNVVADTETERDGQLLLGTSGGSIWRKSYFPNFVEFFDEVIYPKGDPDAVSISKRDVDLLQPDIFVNDTIIDFYIKYLKNQMSLEKRNRFHFFNSFFFRKLIDLDKDPSSSFEGKAAFQRVRKWTRKVNLFEKDYVFIPVNYSYHWSLVVICHPGEVTKLQDGDVGESLKVPCILHMDSMKGSHTVLKDIVQSYLWEEWKEKNKDALEDMSAKFLNFRFVSLELPQQPNAYDCGLFLLHYVERFLEEAPINFSPSKITHYSKFLNFDWFRPEEPCLKRAHIQRLICKILEGEDAPAACSSKPCASDDPANSNAIENNLEFISKRCSPSKSVHRNLSGSQSSEGIEITLLQTASSQYGGDSSLVLREFMEAGASAEPFLDVQYQTFDQAATFGAMGHVEDVEACGQFVYTRSNINPDSVPYLSNGLGADIRKAEHDDFREYPETSIGGSGNSSEVEIPKSNSLENTLVMEERFDEPRSPSAENPTSAPNQMLDVAGFQSGDQILNSHGTADNDLGILMLPEFASQKRCNAQENGDVTCADIDVVCETLPSETDEQGSETVSEILVSERNGMLGLERTDKAETAEQQGSETVSEVLVSETDGMLDVDRIGKDSTEDELVSESDKQLVAKRTGDVMLPESDEQQPAKRLRLDSSLEGEKESAKVDP